MIFGKNYKIDYALRKDISYRQYDTFEFTVDTKIEKVVGFDYTNYRIRLNVKVEDTLYSFPFSYSSTEYLLSISANVPEPDLPVGKYEYDIRFTDVTGKTYLHQYGHIQILPSLSITYRMRTIDLITSFINTIAINHITSYKKELSISMTNTIAINHITSYRKELSISMSNTIAITHIAVIHSSTTIGFSSPVIVIDLI